MACACVSLVLCGTAVLFSLKVQDWDVSGLVRMTPGDLVARIATRYDPDFRFVDEGHYDGVYFYAIALDPLAQGEAHSLIDAAVYRYGHAGYGQMVFLLSGRNEERIPVTMLFLALAGAGYASYGASRLAAFLGWSPWGGLAVALQPGLVYATTVLTSEPIGLALLVFAVLAWLNNRRFEGAVLLALLCLVKEPFVLVPVGLFVWDIVRRRPRLWTRALILGSALVPVFGWWCYLRAVFDKWPWQENQTPLVWPLKGWFQAFTQAAQMGLEAADRTQIGTVALPLLIVALALLLAGIVRSLWLRSPIDPLFFLQACIVLMATPPSLVYPKDFLRVAVVPLAMLVPVLFGGRPSGRQERFKRGTRPETEAEPVPG
jgi:hypothetical protein